MTAVRTVLLALCCAIGGAAQALPSAQVMREAEFRAGGTLLPAQHAVEESRRAIVALRAYAASGEEPLFRDARRRALHLASFDPRAGVLFNKAWPESVPALLVIARTLADHDRQAKLLSLQLEREK